MTDYIPGWQFSFPEPDASDGYIGRSTGPRRSREDVPVCQGCGQDVEGEPYSLFGPVFCSRECRDKRVGR